MANQVEAEQQLLAVHHEHRTDGGQSDLGPETVRVDRRVDEGRDENGEDLKGLGEFEPEKGGDDQDRVVEETEPAEASAAEDRKEGAEEVEEAGEVEDVRPEEDAPRGARAEGKAEEPLDGGGPRAPPQPPRVADLGGGGEERAEEDDGGDQAHRDAVDCRDWAERDWPESPAAEEVEGEGVEEEV